MVWRDKSRHDRLDWTRFAPKRHERTAQSPRQILRLPDERLRFPSYGGHAGARGLRRDRQRRGRRSRHPQHLPHPRKGGGEGLFRARPHPRAQGGRRAGRPPHDDRGRRLRRAGRRRGNHPPRAGGRSRGRPAELSPPARPARARAKRREAVVDTEFPVEDKFDRSGRARAATRSRARGVSAFVTVQEGCDKFCTFCVVPYTRGAEVSRPVAKIVAEVERLADAGVREITLIGQNVNAYHGDGPDGRPWTLGRLLRASPKCRASRGCATPPAIRATWTTSLIAAHRDLPALMPYLHLPVQSGSDRILAAMNRRHTRADYLDVDRAAARGAPDLAFSSDFIVGFPGETEDDFRDTLALVDEVGYASAFSFKYSPRPGTPAAEMDDQVPEEVKAERLQRLQAAIDRQQAAFNARLRRPHLRRAVRKARHAILARSSAAPHICSRCRSWRRPTLIGDDRGGDDYRGRHQQPVRRARAMRRRAPSRCRRQELEAIALTTTGQRILVSSPAAAERDGRDADRARLRRQPARLGAVRPVRTEPRADRAPARRRRRAARQSRHHRGLARRLRAGAPRAGRPLRAAQARR